MHFFFSLLQTHFAFIKVNETLVAELSRSEFPYEPIFTNALL